MELGVQFTFFIVSFISLFTIVNPFSTVSVFLSITEGDTKSKKKAMAKKASIIAAIVLIIFALMGNYILSFFSITLDAFRVAGGIIIASIGFRMIKAQRERLPTPEERKAAIEKEDVSVIPLAIPLLSGPGAMTTSIALMSQTQNLTSGSLVILAILVVCFLSYFILAKADSINRFLGETGRRVSDRLMGLLVLVVGVQFVMNGISGFLAQLI